MSRLIDADRLLKYKTDHEMISTHIIWNAPTVEAIPISYIKEIIEYWRSLDYGYWDAKIEDFEWLIKRWEYDQDIIRKSIEQAPTVDAEPVRHGFWNVYKWSDDKENLNTEMTCSVCGITFFSPNDITADEFHYCPYCGAKMDEEAEQ